MSTVVVPGPPHVAGFRAGEALVRGARDGPAGWVWSGVDEAGDLVVLRTIPASGEDRDRLLARLDTLAAARHPHLARVRASRVDEAGVAVVLDLVPGVDLATWVRARGALPPPELERLAAGLAAALAHLHGLGLAHGDLSPRNVLVRDGGDAVLVDLADTGLGTPGHVAAERCDERGLPNVAPDEVSDVAELAALLAWAAAGGGGPSGEGGERADADRGGGGPAGILIARSSSSSGGGGHGGVREDRDHGGGPDVVDDGLARLLDRASGPRAGRPAAAELAVAADEAVARRRTRLELLGRRPTSPLGAADLAGAAIRTALLAAPTYRPGRRSARPRRTQRHARGTSLPLGLTVAAAAASVLLLAGVGVLAARSSASSVVGGLPATARAEIDAVLARRDAALEAGNLTALARAVVPGSQAWRHDATLAQALAGGAGVGPVVGPGSGSGTGSGAVGVVAEPAAPVHVSGLHTQVLAAAPASGAAVRAELRQGAHHRFTGGLWRPVPAQAGRCLVLELADDGRISGWRACA
ncbi:protein kinase domain-containing protein [Miniimonas arenae]|uniref:protein kinase domain-containing protein n=1 Tax=Miniimonas arenae TaxID=676201 RepID=UPI0015D622C2|nr:protein kinase [Miniimonas arenae]